MQPHTQQHNEHISGPGFDDRVRNGCGLLISDALTFAAIGAWIYAGAALVNWAFPL